MSEKQRYSTIDEVVAYAISPMCGEFRDDYDLYAIANELFEFTADEDESGIQHGNAYFIERDGVNLEDVMVRHDHGEELDEIVASAWDGEGTYTITISDDHMSKAECDEMGDLKHELHEFFEYYDCWSEKVVIVKIYEDE